jgi:hypothetical protein
MSPTMRHRLHRQARRLCVECREQRARFKYRGQVRPDRDHTLCFRTEVERQRADRATWLLPLFALFNSASNSLQPRRRRSRERTAVNDRLGRLRGSGRRVGCVRGLKLARRPPTGSIVRSAGLLVSVRSIPRIEDADGR